MSLSETTAPPAGAVVLRVTVQLAVPGVFTDVGVQLNALIRGPTAAGTETLPLEAEADKVAPLADDAYGLLTWTGRLRLPVVVAGKVIVITATVPLGIVFAFNPINTHVVELVKDRQETDLLAVVAAAAGTTDTPLKSDDEYVIVH